MTLSYTTHLHLAVPDFLSEPWHSEFAAAMDSIDNILYNALLSGSVALWVNSHAYTIGSIVLSPDNGQLYSCAVNHTSSASPQTFTAELAAHPTFWTTFAPILATQAEAEAGTENSHYMSALRTKQAIAALVVPSAQQNVNCGVLKYVSATQLSFTPFFGNQIKVAGKLYTIPITGISGLGNTGVFINGGSGNLAANTFYLVFAFVDFATQTLIGQYYTTAGGITHRPSLTSGNEGVEVWYNGAAEVPGFPFLGVARTNNLGQFLNGPSQRYVRSWYNPPVTPMSTLITATTLVPSTTYSTLSNLSMELSALANDTFHVEFSAPFYQAAGLVALTELAFGLNATIPNVDAWAAKGFVAGENIANIGIALTISLPEGFHTINLLARYTTNQTSLFVGANSAGARPTMRGLIMPAEGIVP